MALYQSQTRRHLINIIQLLTYVLHRSIWLNLLVNNTSCLRMHKSTIVYCIINVCHFGPLKPLTLRMEYAKLLDVLISLPVSHEILPHVVCFATSHPETMRNVVISAAMDRHLSQSEDVYFKII